MGSELVKKVNSGVCYLESSLTALVKGVSSDLKCSLIPSFVLETDIAPRQSDFSWYFYETECSPSIVSRPPPPLGLLTVKVQQYRKDTRCAS